MARSLSKQALLKLKKANHEKLEEKSDTLNQLKNSSKGIIDRLNELGAKFEKAEDDIKGIENMTKTATSTAVEELGTM